MNQETAADRYSAQACLINLNGMVVVTIILFLTEGCRPPGATICTLGEIVTGESIQDVLLRSLRESQVKNFWGITTMVPVICYREQFGPADYRQFSNEEIMVGHDTEPKIFFRLQR